MNTVLFYFAVLGLWQSDIGSPWKVLSQNIFLCNISLISFEFCPKVRVKFECGEALFVGIFV